MKMILEVNENFKELVNDEFNSILHDILPDALNIPSDSLNIISTPPIDENYWALRVKVSKNQAIVAFPKFLTMGIGFQKEADWNTNLPYSCDAEKIFDHIKHNKGSKKIKDEDCITAINIIKTALKNYKNN